MTNEKRIEVWQSLKAAAAKHGIKLEDAFVLISVSNNEILWGADYSNDPRRNQLLTQKLEYAAKESRNHSKRIAA
jgi:hypothetical protein